MATNFPSSLDSLSNPTGSSSLTSPDHAGQHADANDAIEALQAKVGVDGSAVTTSFDYKISNGIFPKLNVDSGVLVVDTVNDRVGINVPNPSAALDVFNTTNGIGMRITNIGTGNSFVVEDEASPDSTPFVISNSGNVGIGYSNPTSKLSIYANGSSSAITVTNDGIGYSMVVEDIFTDTTPFVIDGNGNVGIKNSSPSYNLDNAGTTRSIDYLVGTGTKSMPRGVIQYGQTSTSPVSITAESTQISFSITAVAGRIYRITYFEPQITSPATSGAFLTGNIKTGSTRLNYGILQVPVAATMNFSLFASWTGTLSAGTQTISASLSSGAGTWTVNRSATGLGILTVEDLGTT